MRFLTTPQVTVNSTAALPGDLFSVYGTGAGGINSVANQTDYPINGYSTGAFAGMYGENTGSGQGILGQNTANGVGVFGQVNNAAAFGVFGNNSGAGIGVGGVSAGNFGVNGVTNGALATGVRGFNSNATGTGIIALGNNITAGTVSAAGSGIAANGTASGTFSIGTNATTGIGVMAGGNNITVINNTGVGEGVAANGLSYGSSNFATGTLAADRWGGYFDHLASPAGFAYVGGRTGGVDYGILSLGAKSTMVKGLGNENRIMYCTEAPEVLFQDFGNGQLSNGTAHITIDPILAKNIYVSEEKPLKVFIQLEGDCKGVYVTNKSANGFDVVELSGGNSNVKFTWQIVATRADYTENGVTSEFSKARFNVGPDRVKPVTIQGVTATENNAQPQTPKK
jgi:hypothetical protein